MKITDSSFKDVHAIEVDAGVLTALFLPELGAKCASLKDNKNGREFLEQAPETNYKKLDYAADYEAAECSGFDDMFPTCTKYRCNQFPWEGTELPDHGEVCGLKWHYKIENESLHMWVYSPRFGYQFEKWVRSDKMSLIMDYRVTNHTQFEFDFLYGAHCMIAAEEGARIETEFGVGEQATLIFDKSGKRGKHGSPFIWQADSGLTPSRSDKTNYKIYFDNPAKHGWCTYTYNDGTCLKLNYSADKLPYLGIWFNWGDLKGMYNFAFEPCSGSYDRPDMARIHNQYSTLAPHGVYEWSLAFSL